MDVLTTGDLIIVRVGARTLELAADLLDRRDEHEAADAVRGIADAVAKLAERLGYPADLAAAKIIDAGVEGYVHPDEAPTATELLAEAEESNAVAEYAHRFGADL